MTVKEFLDAAFKGDVTTIEEALSTDGTYASAASDGSHYEKGVTALHLASAAGHLSVADRLLQAGALVNGASQDGSPLTMATWGGHLELAERLIAAGADVNNQDQSGGTALHVAALKGFVSIASLLLQHGADPNARTTQGPTDMYSGSPQVLGEAPMHTAARHGHVEVVRLLLEIGAFKGIMDHSGETPRQWAIHYCQKDVIPLLF